MRPQIFDKAETVNGVVNTSKAKQAFYRQAKKHGMTMPEYRAHIADLTKRFFAEEDANPPANHDVPYGRLKSNGNPAPVKAKVTKSRILKSNEEPDLKPKSTTAVKRAARFYTGMMEELFSVREDHWTKEDPYTRLLTLHGGEGRYPWVTPTKGYTLPPTEKEFEAQYDAAMSDFEALLADGEVAAEAKVTPEPAKVGRTKTHLAVPPDPLEIHVGEPMCGANTSPWGAPPVIATDGLATCKTCLTLKERYS